MFEQLDEADRYMPQHWAPYDAFKEEKLLAQEALDKAYGIEYSPKHAKKEGNNAKPDVPS